MADTTGVETAKLKLTLAENRVVLLPGQNTEQQLTLANYSGMLDNFELSVEGLPAEWFSFSRPTLNLFPNWSETVELTIFVAPDLTPGLYHVAVKAVSASQPDLRAEAELLIEVRAAENPAYPGSGLPDYYQIQASALPQPQPEPANNQPWLNQLGAYSPANGNGATNTNDHQYPAASATNGAQSGAEAGLQTMAPATLQDRPTAKIYQAPSVPQDTAPFQAIPAAIPPAIASEPAAPFQTEIAEPRPEPLEATAAAALIEDIPTVRPQLNLEPAPAPDLAAELPPEPALETQPGTEPALETAPEPEPPVLEPRPRLKIQSEGLELEADTGRLVCLPGSHTEQQIGLVNLTSRPDLFELKVEGLAANWYSFSYSQLNLFPHWNEEVYFRVDLPADAPAGLYPARLVATALSQPQVKAEISFELEVPAVYTPGTATPGYTQPEKAEIESGQLQLSMEQTSLSLLPGHTSEQQISLSNETNLTGTINLSIEGLEPGWYSFSTASLNLFPGWQEELYLRIQVPAAARAGFYQARLVAATVHGTLPPAEIPFELEVQALPQPAEPLPTLSAPEVESDELQLPESEITHPAPLAVFNPPAPEPAAPAGFWNDASPAQPAQASALSLFARAATEDETGQAEFDTQPTVQFNYGSYINTYQPPASPQPDNYQSPEPAAPAAAPGAFRQPPVAISPAPAPEPGWPAEFAQAPITPNPPVALWQPDTAQASPAENYARPAARPSANIQVTLETDRMSVVAGSADEQQIKLMNMTSLPDDFDLAIEGLPANWYSFSAASLNLFPNWMESIQLKIELSPKVRPNSYTGKLIVTSRNQPGVRTEARLTVEVLAPLKVEARVQPNKAKGFKASYDLILRNRSMSEGLMTLELSPETQFCQATFQPPQVLLPAGQSKIVKMKVNLRPKTPGEQAQQIQPFEVAIKPQWRIGPEIVNTPEVTAGAEYIHESRWAFIGRHPWLFGLATLLLIVILLWSWLILPAIRTGLISSVDRFDFSGAAGKSIRVEQSDFTGKVQSQVPLIGSFVQLEVRFTEQDQKATVYMRSFFLSADLKGSLQINPKGNLIFVADKPGQPTSFPWTFAPPTQVVDKINTRLRTWLGPQNLGMDKAEIEGNTLFIRLKTCKANDPGCN
jgi:uncharacterized membrane protein